MTRYRDLIFGLPISSWQSTMQLAGQIAIEAEEASPDPQSFAIYLSPGVTIEIDDGEPPELTPDLKRWAEGLQAINAMEDSAEEFVIDCMIEPADDPIGKARWRTIGQRIAAIREAPERERSEEWLPPLAYID